MLFDRYARVKGKVVDASGNPVEAFTA
jgi:hypothetical protein